MTKNRPSNRKEPRAKSAGKFSAISSADLVELTGLTERRLRELATNGRIPGPEGGIWDGSAVIRILVAARANRYAAGEELTVTKARAQREYHKSRREKVLADREESLVVPVEDAARLVTRAASQVRTRLLALPPKAAALMEGKDVTAREQVLRQEVDDAFADLTRLEQSIRKP